MAAEAESGEGEAAPAKKGGKRKLIIIAAAAVIAVLAIGGVLYFVVGIGKPAPSASAAAAAPQSFIFNLPEMTVNLDTSGQGQSFMKLSVALEVTNEAMMTEIQPRLAKVIDAFQVYLRELRPSDLAGLGRHLPAQGRAVASRQRRGGARPDRRHPVQRNSRAVGADDGGAERGRQAEPGLGDRRGAAAQRYVAGRRQAGCGRVVGGVADGGRQARTMARADGSQALIVRSTR